MIHLGLLPRVYVTFALSLTFLGGCHDPRANGPMHQRLKWKAEDFFSDQGVISLCKAIEAKDIAEIDRLAKSGVNINAKGRANMTPLLWAFPMGEDVFKKMLELGADPNVKLTENYLLLKGKTVTFACIELVDSLIYSQYFHDVPMENYLRLVLEHGGNPNSESGDGETPLFSVRHCFRRFEEKLDTLLRAGADINHKNRQGNTPAASAVTWRNDYLLCLLMAGADYRILNNDGWDLVLLIENEKTMLEKDFQEGRCESRLAALQPVIDWLTNEEVDWKAAHAALESSAIMENLKNLPADFKHRPWLPQRPTLKKPNANNSVKEK